MTQYGGFDLFYKVMEGKKIKLRPLHDHVIIHRKDEPLLEMRESDIVALIE